MDVCECVGTCVAQPRHTLYVRCRVCVCVCFRSKKCNQVVHTSYIVIRCRVICVYVENVKKKVVHTRHRSSLVLVLTFYGVLRYERGGGEWDNITLWNRRNGKTCVGTWGRCTCHHHYVLTHFFCFLKFNLDVNLRKTTERREITRARRSFSRMQRQRCFVVRQK